ncbi:hypothetical protein B9Z55_021587 [Caenorhabditis nigoni]|nr:hypothetical protein B9Z55_021587 [Caenorhabditis nigoni]
MPIRILSLPIADLQYALNCMEIDELIAFSLCSKRTKNLVKDSKIPIESIYAEVYENYICLEIIMPSNLRGVQDDPDLLFIYLDFSNPWITLERKNGMEVWRKEGFTQSDWIAHFLNIFNGSMIRELMINGSFPISYLDTVKRTIPKFQKLHITDDCSTELAKIAFRELIPSADKVQIDIDPFDNELHISQFLKPNLNYVCLLNWRHPYKLQLDDLLLANCTFLTMSSANITERELNRFVKLWMKSSHIFYRPGYIEMSIRNEINREELFKGIKYQTLDNCHLLKLADGKELEVCRPATLQSPLVRFIDFRTFCRSLSHLYYLSVCALPVQLMPIRFLSLPFEDLQHALNCMDIGDLIAFSLCSKRTKNLVKGSNSAIEPIYAEVNENQIRFEIMRDLQEIRYIRKPSIIFLTSSDSQIKIDCGYGFKGWWKQEYTQSDWIAHVLSIFDESMIDVLNIGNASLSYLDTVKQIIPKCRTLHISHLCSYDVAKMAFFKLSSIAVEKLEIKKNIFDNGNDISKALTQNLKSVSFIDWENPFKLELNDLLVLNIANLSIRAANITVKELNRFLKLWMKSNRRCYRPKRITIGLNDEIEINPEEVLKGIKYQIVDNEPRLKRADGKVLEIFVLKSFVVFKFQ